MTTGWSDTDVRIRSADGWEIGALVRGPADTGAAPVPGAVLVPGSRHERDAYATVADELERAGVASLRMDVRGRGTSLGATRYAHMAPRQRRRLALDVAAALVHLAGRPGVDGGRLALVAEQDTAADAVDGASGDERLRAVVVLSARHGDRLADALSRRHLPVFGLVSSEDRDGLRATVAAYLAGDETSSRLEVFAGLGFGTTMLSTRQFEHPDAEPLDAMLAAWTAGVV